MRRTNTSENKKPKRERHHHGWTITVHIVLSMVYFPFLSVNQFEERLQACFHSCETQYYHDRGQSCHDKVCHVRRILDVVLTKYKTNYHPHKEQSIDEAMIGFKGRQAFKQYLPAKPSKFMMKLLDSRSAPTRAMDVCERVPGVHRSWNGSNA